MKEINIKLGKRIKEAREKINKSQAEFAYLMGVLPAHLNRWEKGRIAPGWVFLVKISEICKISLDWLLTGTIYVNYGNNSKIIFKEAISDKEILEIIEWLASHPDDKNHIHQLIKGKKMVEEAFKNLKKSDHNNTNI